MCLVLGVCSIGYGYCSTKRTVEIEIERVAKSEIHLFSMGLKSVRLSLSQQRMLNKFGIFYYFRLFSSLPRHVRLRQEMLRIALCTLLGMSAMNLEKRKKE